MLQLKNIVKTYVTGDLTQDALNDVSVNFRESEFVSILGQSGSGKTTLLNIIGGLDRYTSGDLIINGVSTKQYKDSHWDNYRNSSIGFVFQSYNLIPHQSVLANVEMALTLAGVSKKERKARAKAVLQRVGLGDQLHKRPNQMSGGQMQRVAIARALVNNPDILLADEPTGALDSETSVQIMELLKEIAKDKLVIMVTHNPELAQNYSTRIINLLDGKIVSDSNPYEEENLTFKPKKKNKVSMSFLTALSLSFNNLRTKKGRTILTSLAGSIGIIGIALILALSTGMNQYIEDIQKETMTSYPITITSQTMDMSGFMGMQGEMMGEVVEKEADKSKIYADFTMLEAKQLMVSSIVENNLTEFKKYLDNPDSEIHQYIGENGIKYSYEVDFSVYSYNSDEKFIDSSEEVEEKDNSPMSSAGMDMMSQMSAAVLGSGASGAKNFSEIMEGADGSTISPIITESYDMLYGSWPEEYNEVVLVVNSQSGIDLNTLYQLGYITREEYKEAEKDIKDGKTPENITFDFKEACEHTFYLLPASYHYEEKENGNFAFIENKVINEEKLLENALELKITGVICPKEDADNAIIGTAVGYIYKLTDYVIEKTDESPVILAQEENKNINVLNGMRFESATDEEKAEDAKEYLKGLSISEKAYFYQLMMYYASSEDTASSGMPMVMDETSMAAILDMWLENDPDKEILISVYEEYIAGSTYEDNMQAFGKVSYDAPSSISIYTDSFENKDNISLCIENYNTTALEENRITYTDYVALLTSSITTIINGISYVLVAFVAISLVVSCIMIGIITHISVMERTKEIGILRALGASKRNISQVFNAETFIIGWCSGFMGIGVSMLLLIPINKLIRFLTDIEDLGAVLPPQASVILIAISIIITVTGGLLPAKKAAKKDPVIALRTE